MRGFYLIILCHFVIFIECQQHKICLKYKLSKSSNLINDDNDKACEIQGDALSKDEITNLKSKCDFYGDDVRDSTLKWFKSRYDQIIGIESFGSLCNNRSIGQLVWVPWKDNEMFSQNYDYVKNFSTIAKRIGKAEKESYCFLNAESENCVILFEEDIREVRHDLFVLVERRPIRYEVRDVTCEKGTVFEVSEVDLANATFTNDEEELRTMNTTVEYTRLRGIKLKLERLPVDKIVPFYLRVNNSLYPGSEEWNTEIMESMVITKQVEFNSSLDVVVTGKQQKKRCKVTTELFQYYDDTNYDSSNVTFMVVETAVLDPRIRQAEALFEEDSASLAYIFIPVLVFVILIGLCACCTNRCWGGQDRESTNSLLLCLACMNCTECWGSLCESGICKDCTCCCGD